jgi:hypothetical protein
MDYLKLVRTDTGSYLITVIQQQKLFVLAQLLITSQIRKQVRSLLEGLPEFRLGQEVTFDFLPEYTITMRRANEEQLVITLFKKYESAREEDNPLIIDIYINILIDLIDNFEDLLIAEAPEIYIIMSDITTITAQESLPADTRTT